MEPKTTSKESKEINKVLATKVVRNEAMLTENQKITKVLATKVARIGWDSYWEIPMCEYDDVHFRPLHDEGDCMNLWDKFSKDRETQLHCKNGLYVASVIGGAYFKDFNAMNRDRKRAICECMVKAASE